MAYTYQADVWCDTCGAKICKEITAAGNAPEDPDDEHTCDSGDFPKRYDPENDSSDSPQNCASGDCAGSYGTFLENALTTEGYAYLKEMLDNHGENLPPHAKEWADYYQFSYHKNEYSQPPRMAGR